MKKVICVFCFFVILLFSIKSEAQEIPNGDFEEWFTCLCDPPYWSTNNLYPPLECLQVFQSGSPYSGNYCIEGIVDSCSQLVALFPPLIQSFDIPLDSKPEALHGYYKFIPVGTDLFNGNIKLYKNNVLIGEGSFISQESVSSFTEFILNIEYSSNDTPDVAIIKFTIDSSLVDNKLHHGSKWYIDYLTFGSSPSITVSAPNGGEIWTVGTPHSITWTSSNVNDVKLEYTTNDGINWITISASTPSGGTYSWTVPNAPSSQCKVRVSDAINSSINDISNNFFTISAAPTVTTTSPNGGEVWPLSSSQNIEWTSSNVSFVNIEISKNNGTTWNIIDTLIESTGIYSWMVNGSISNQCRIKISDNSDIGVFDISDSSFKITPAVGVEDEIEKIPTEFLLSQNYPNPFNPVTTIGYVLKEKTNAKLILLNAIGEEVSVLVNEEQEKGYHKVDFNASTLASGVYFYRLQAGSFIQTRKMILLK